jgi:AMP deaminase
MDMTGAAASTHSRASSSVGDDDNGYYGFQDEGQLSSSPDFDHTGDMSTGVDGGRKSAFYDYKQEKTLRQTDAKLFYQQQQQQGAGQSGWNSPVLRASTWGGGGARSKNGSVRSFASSHHHIPSLPSHPFFAGGAAASRSHTPGIPATGLASLDKPREDSEVQGAGMGRFDPHGILDTVSASVPQYTVPPPDGGPIDPKGGYASREFTNWHFLLLRRVL